MFFYYYGAVMFALTEAIAVMWVLERFDRKRGHK